MKINYTKNLYKIMVNCLIFIILIKVFDIVIVNGAAILTISSSPTILYENNIDGAIIDLHVEGDSFKSSIGTMDLSMNNAPSGLLISNVSYIGLRDVKVYLSFDGTDFDDSIDNFEIEVKVGGTVSGDSIKSNKIYIYAIDEDTNIIATSSPQKLLEYNLNGSIIILESSNIDFEASIDKDDIIINNAPPGLFVESALRISPDICRLILEFDGTNMEQDISDMSFLVTSNGLKSNGCTFSNNVFIEQSDSIEGQGFFFVSGESYPDNINITGYNSRSRDFYFSIRLMTTKSVSASQIAYFYYYIEIFNQAGTKIGEYGNYDTPQVLLSSNGNQVALKINEKIQIAEELNEQYRIVVTVKNVSVVNM